MTGGRLRAWLARGGEVYTEVYNPADKGTTPCACGRRPCRPRCAPYECNPRTPPHAHTRHPCNAAVPGDN